MAPRPLLIKGADDILGAAALGTVAGYQQEGVRHGLAHLSQLLGIGSAYTAPTAE